MTSSDKRMDRALAELAVLSPPCSAWSAVEAYLNRAEIRGRRWRYLGFVSAAMAASFVVAVLVSNFPPRSEAISGLHKTVEAAIRDAMPKASFTDLQISAGKTSLEKLLVSAKPRQAIQGKFLGGASANTAKSEKAASPKASPVNEF